MPVTRSEAAEEAVPSRWDWRRDAGGPLLIYAATRLAQLIVLTWMDPPGGPSIQSKLLSWDSGWFLDVARNGYPHGYTYDATGQIIGNGLAFFPVYPLLIRGGHALGLSYGVAALTISWIAGAAAAVLVYALMRALVQGGEFGERVRSSATVAGYALVVLVCAQPMSVVLSMGYAESLFVALVAGCLLAAYRRSWIVAGVLGVAAGLTRPTGAALAIALAVAAAMRIADENSSLRERITAICAGVAALASVPAYIIWVGLRVGEPNAWFVIQTAGWGSTFDFGSSTWTFIRQTLQAGDGWVAMSVVAILFAAVIALLVALMHRGWLPLFVYGVIAFVLVAGQAGFFHSKPRLFVPVLLLFVPAALAATRTPPRNAALWLSAYALVGLWYGAYMITVWQYAI
ncbi:MAG TPA: mannosyltransferase family protein [Micromonosporaceae bacterium]